MPGKMSGPCIRLYTPCIRKRRLLLFIIILYGIATYFLRDQVWNGLSYVRPKTEPMRTSTEETPRRKLVFLQLLFRHGHHSPFGLYPADPNMEYYWVEGLGQLTKIGRLQHYLVGKYMRDMYDGFLSYNVQEVDCMTSFAYRSVYGAYSFLAGFYPAPPNKRMAIDLPYQPIQCSYLPLEKDKYLQSLPNCPMSELEKSLTFESKEALEFMANYRELYAYWANNSGLEIDNYGDAGSFYKNLLAQKEENLTIPVWAEITWEALKQNINICYHFNFRTRLIQRLRAGPLLEEIVKKMRHKIQNPKWKLKTYVYSGHGSNIGAVLNALRVFNYESPKYASTIMFELYEEVGSNHTIRLLYSNATNPEKHITPPYVLQLPGCGEYCPLEELERQTADLFPLDWEQECGEYESSEESNNP